MQQGGGWVGHTCQKVKFNKMRVKRRTVEKRKKRGHMKLYSCSSQALIRWQILFWMMAILPKRETKSRKGGRWRRGSCTLLYGGHRGKLQSSVSHLEYLTHCERHYFSLISRVFSDCHGHFDRNRLGPSASILGMKQEWRLRPLESDDDESKTQELFYEERKWEAGDYVCLQGKDEGRS